MRQSRQTSRSSPSAQGQALTRPLFSYSPPPIERINPAHFCKDPQQSIAETCPMDNSALPHASTEGSGSSASNVREKARGKKFPRFKPRNPLKSLDSHERNQENPRQSNPHGAGFQSETARSQENPNGSTGPRSRARRRYGAKPTPSKGKAPRTRSRLLTRRGPRVRRSPRSLGSARGSARRSASARPRDRAEPDDRRRGSAGDSRPRPPTAR
jgi:hypothetical protein